MAANVGNYFHVEETFVRLGWDPILNLPERIYLNLVREFYTNMVDKEDHS